MFKFLKKIYYYIVNSPLSLLLAPVFQQITTLHYYLINIIWKQKGAKMPTPDDIALVRDNVTFIYKSFERQKMAKQLYWNIQKYYPGVRVIIADDSKTPLALQDTHLKVIQSPFNSGLSKGLNCALAEVTTPYVIRMDDDELLTLCTDFHAHLRFLQAHPEADLVSVLCLSAPWFRSFQKSTAAYYQQSMANAPKKLKIPHMTHLDDSHIVLGKVPQVFIARTDAIKSIGYDDNIRMIDHNEFFFRAAGNIVSVLALSSFVFHRHNQFDRNYAKYRYDIAGDLNYIKAKIALLKSQRENNTQ